MELCLHCSVSLEGFLDLNPMAGMWSRARGARYGMVPLE